MASKVTQNRNNQKFCHLNLIKRLDLTTSVKNIQGTEDYVITTETVSKTQTGYQRNDLVSSTHPEKKFARGICKAMTQDHYFLLKFLFR